MSLLKNSLSVFLAAFLCLILTNQYTLDEAPTVHEPEPISPPETSSYPNLRIGTDFEHFLIGTPEWHIYIKGQLIPAVLSYLEAALKVRYPSLSPIRATERYLCGFETPASLKSGINADLVVFFNSKNDTKGGWMAAASHCKTSPDGIKRPIIANIGINLYAIGIADPVNKPLIHDLYINVLLHEFIHVLGMNGPLFNFFVDSNGEILKDHIRKIPLNGKSRTVFDLQPLTSKLRDYYNCPTIPGLFLEDYGGAHIERRFFQWEIMSTSGIVGSKISFVTLGFLEGTGWYVPDYNYAEPYYFGKGQGCEFYADKVADFNFPEYCQGNEIGCTEVGNGGGYCVGDSLLEGNRVYTAQIHFNCENPKGVKYTPFSNKQIYGRGLGSKCFSGNLTHYQKAAQISYCLNATCTESGTEIEVMWGDKKLICDKKGPMTVEGYNGEFNCPDPIRFCNTLAQPACLRNCMGRGTCVNGKCVCNPGFEGTDCGFKIVSQKESFADEFIHQGNDF